MLTKQSTLHPAAHEMNIVPGLHSLLISVPKLVDTDYTSVFNKSGATINDDYTRKISASHPPVLATDDRCRHTCLWKLLLDTQNKDPNKNQPTNVNSPMDGAINVNFDQKSTQQTFLWYHAAVGFPTKETFTKAVLNGNYATWPKLTICWNYPGRIRT